MTIYLADSMEDREKVYKLRYQVLVHEFMKKIHLANHSEKIIQDELDRDDTLQLFIEEYGHLNGSVRLNVGTPFTFSSKYHQPYQWNLFRHYFQDQFALLSWLVLNNHTDADTLRQLYSYVYQLAREEGARFLFTSCNPPLLPMYEQLGFQRYARNFNDPDFGYMVPLVLVLDDHEYLKQIGSPLYEASLDYEHNPMTRRWFEQNIPQAKPATVSQKIDQNEFWHLFHVRMIQKPSLWKIINEKLSKKPLESILLLKGLTEAEAQKVVELGKLNTYRKGDKIIRKDEVGNEMFVIISGRVAVTQRINQTDHMIAALDTGEIFGEMAFVSHAVRTADIMALEDVEVLVLSQDYFNRLMTAAPEIASRVLLNLSIILVGRLKDTTKRLVDAKS